MRYGAPNHVPEPSAVSAGAKMLRASCPQAMVLAATSADGATVELVEPPEGVAES